MVYLYTLFVAWITASAFVQAADHPLKKVISPGLTAACGVLVLTGTLMGNVPLRLGLTLAGAILLLAASDFTFERSEANPSLFTLAMVLGVLSGFIIGTAINLTALSSTPSIIHGFAFGIAFAAALFVYRYLAVPKELRIPVLVYLAQAVILLGGGLASFYSGNIHFGLWGVLLFVSDSLVGLRAFPNPQKPVRQLDASRILFGIIVIYYPALAVMVSWALMS